MHRKSISYLEKWLESTDRKPLIIRGARQVGKTWLVRYFAKLSGKKLIEVNFEKQPSYLSLFASNDTQQILLNLSTAYNEDINPENSLLFLDEIQAAPEIFGKLRWFAEYMPQLAVVAAGSLLDFMLTDHAFSMPVGRISYMYLEPLSFEEFLLAKHKEALVDYLIAFNFPMEIPAAIHEQLLALFKEYLFVGGLPAVVTSWITDRSLSKVSQIQHDLLATYHDDFAKYKGRIATERLSEVMKAVPSMLGQKFMFSRVNATIQVNTIKHVLDLLNKARICHPVISCAANGIPLGAEINEKYFKEIFLDTGLCSAVLGLNLMQITEVKEIILINQGGIAEQVVGQLLRTINPPYIEPMSYYWLREERNANAEVDYVIQHGNRVIPIEVKAGSTGGLKSLHFFMGLKKLSLAVRINSDLPKKTLVKVKNSTGEKVEYTLLSIPFYFTEQIQRLLDS